jgi:hypothetical protein
LLTRLFLNLDHDKATNYVAAFLLTSASKSNQVKVGSDEYGFIPPSLDARLHV